jgi:hypothetical protein
MEEGRRLFCSLESCLTVSGVSGALCTNENIWVGFLEEMDEPRW